MSRFPSVQLTDLCDVLSGGTPSTKKAEYWNGGIPWASVKDFNTDSRWFTKTEKNLSQEGLENCSSVLLEPGDLILSARGTVGVVAQAGIQTAFNQSNYGLRAKSQVSENDYLYYALVNAKRALLGDAHGGMFDTITRATLDRLSVPYPPLTEQKRIAQTLGVFDEKIALNHDLSKTLEAFAESIFKSWFIDFDPVKAKMAGEAPFGMDAKTAALFPDSMEDTELGEIPSGWTVGPISQVLTLQGGYSFKSKDWKNSGVPVVKIGSVKPGFVDAAQTSFVSPELAATVPSKFLLPRGSLVIGLTGYVGEVGLVERFPETPLLNQRVARFGLVNSPWRIPFAYCIARSEKFKEDVIASATGSAQANVSTSDILALKRAIPTGGLIERFDALFEPLFEQMLLLREQGASLRELRDSLLPRLVSGELEIPEEMLGA